LTISRLNRIQGVWEDRTHLPHKFLNFIFCSKPSVLIRQGLPQPDRLATLNDIAITQMRTWHSACSVKRLK
jgi:hypothetical protein